LLAEQLVLLLLLPQLPLIAVVACCSSMTSGGLHSGNSETPEEKK